MKADRQYLPVEIKWIAFSKEDVITCSLGTNNGADGHQPDGDWWDKEEGEGA